MDFIYSVLWGSGIDNKELETLDEKFKLIVLDPKNKDVAIDEDEKALSENDNGSKRVSRSKPLQKFDKTVFYAKNEASSNKDQEKDAKPIKNSYQSLIMNQFNEQRLDSRPNRRNDFKSDQCGNVFSSESSMKKHKSIHQMEKRMVANKKNIFRCLECRKNFNQHAKLLIHRKSHTQTGSLCNICHTRVEQLESHRKEVHLLEIGFSI